MKGPNISEPSGGSDTKLRIFEKKDYNYAKLSRITFVKGLCITIGAALTVLLLRLLSQGHVADVIAVFIARILHISDTEADILYFKLIGNNMQFILAATIIAFMFLLFQMLLKSYKRYFDEVVNGIDQLMDEEGQISLSLELEIIEHKLNHVRQTLRTRAFETQRAEQKKNDLVVYLAHDIKTPLTSVMGYLSLLDENPDMADEKKLKYIHIAWEKANRLETLIDEFFEIARSNSESIPLKITKIDLYYMMAQISDELYPHLNSCGKHIANNISENMVLYGDSEKLARVFNNILKNAIAYSADNGVITISAQELPGKTVVKFKNKGDIPEDKLHVIFDKFYRLDSSRSSATGGSGLGLAIAKDIVIKHGGEIKAESSNGNTVFIVELPSV